eukprot:592220-Pelagomonas_calceolata.AAC.4
MPPVSVPVQGGTEHVARTVGLVLELAGEDLVEVIEQLVLDDLRVNGGHTIDAVGADHSQVGHVDKPVPTRHVQAVISISLAAGGSVCVLHNPLMPCLENLQRVISRACHFAAMSLASCVP